MDKPKSIEKAKKTEAEKKEIIAKIINIMLDAFDID